MKTSEKCICEEKKNETIISRPHTRESCPPLITNKISMLERFQKKFKTVPILDKMRPDFNFFTKKQNIDFSPKIDEYSFYSEKEIIGEGSQGLVKRVVNKKSNEEFAAKIMRKSDPEGISYYRREFELLKSMSHPCILKVFDFIVREYHQSIVVLMELLSYPTLRDLIRMDFTYKSEVLCAKILFKLLEGVEYLHNSGVCHRDLKPSNIFVMNDGSQLRIIDFGTAQYYQKTEDSHMVTLKELWSPTGTANYKSPEQIVGNTNEKSDIYSVGLILYEMVSKKKPFGKKRGEKLLKMMEEEAYDLESDNWSKFDPSLKVLIRKLLCPDENERITAKEAKNSEWLKKMLV